MQTNLTRRSFLTRTLGGASLLCVPSAIFAKYEEEADAASNEVVLRFSALSDVHFKKNRDCKEADRFQRSMKFMYDYSSQQPYKNFDAMLVAGDKSDHGWDEELLFFKEVMDEGIKEGTTTILCMGNHEFIAGNKKRWEEIFER
ncbi:MAG: metallophosphoesterase, partial [Thermoguttaceae bacterium]|nr:metallophosphoesterase [Thermoguttaceae bacterium]